MFICTLPGSDKFESWKNFHTFDEVMTSMLISYTP